MKRIIFLLAAVFGCLQSSYGVVSDLPDREGPVDFATDITDRAAGGDMQHSKSPFG